MLTTDTIWIAIGFAGQGLFFLRWVVQWWASERSAESHVPVAFWYLSLTGGLVTLAYAIYRKDPVFIAGQSIGMFVYARNLMLIHRPSCPQMPTAAEQDVRSRPPTPSSTPIEQ